MTDLPDWSASGGPDVFTLRAWLAVERAAETLDGLDDSVNFLQDRASAIFGPGVFSRFPQFIAEHELGEDPLGALLADEALLAELLAFLLADDEAPDVDDGFVWLADPPGSRAERFRRAVRGRRRAAALAFLTPPRRRVAGSRARDHRDLLDAE
ncbi:hypothetical protein [Modestobacter altitudinis]|uniref:hypothetical protein n=1 Tax=Modestobacter altitudinis TaxID=2213158 RepID=UPI00110CCDD9|nr:hypothetical protein [Modestobacter altitudinis]